MTKEHKKVLDMLEDGCINVQEAKLLIETLNTLDQPAQSGPSTHPDNYKHLANNLDESPL